MSGIPVFTLSVTFPRYLEKKRLHLSVGIPYDGSNMDIESIPDAITKRKIVFSSALNSTDASGWAADPKLVDHQSV